jgi:hypothetical protein
MVLDTEAKGAGRFADSDSKMAPECSDLHRGRTFQGKEQKDKKGWNFPFHNGIHSTHEPAGRNQLLVGC